MLLLHTKGAKSGQERVNPMMYDDRGDGRLAVFASYAGNDSNPAWYYNLAANPDVTAEIGTETRSFRARIAPVRSTLTDLELVEGSQSGFRRVRNEDQSRDPGGHSRTGVISRVHDAGRACGRPPSTRVRCVRAKSLRCWRPGSR